jgi:branched-subunit amino acid aminotransferase/4-amino-4-deoxychorismate lyase
LGENQIVIGNQISFIKMRMMTCKASTLFDLIKENGFHVEEGKWPGEELSMADEIFLTGTLKKVMPVSHLDGRAVGSGKPGPITLNLLRLYEDLLTKKA